VSDSVYLIVSDGYSEFFLSPSVPMASAGLTLFIRHICDIAHTLGSSRNVAAPAASITADSNGAVAELVREAVREVVVEERGKNGYLRAKKGN
jgi:hypothetical protein